MNSIFKQALLLMLLSHFAISLCAQSLNYSNDSSRLNYPLAFSFIGINARIERDSLFVAWVSFEEQQLQGFNIQVSQKGNNFVNIGSLPAKIKEGATTEKLYYFYSLGLLRTGAPLSLFMGGIIFLVLGSVCKRVLHKAALAVIFIAVLGFVACNKGAAVDMDAPAKLKYNDIEYLRVEMIDKNNDTGYSKIVKVIKY